jgi:hypothetical protein
MVTGCQDLPAEAARDGPSTGQAPLPGRMRRWPAPRELRARSRPLLAKTQRLMRARSRAGRGTSKTNAATARRPCCHRHSSPAREPARWPAP